MLGDGHRARADQHAHAPFQTLLKGLGDDMVLKDWFTCMTGPSAAELTVDDVYAAARHGCVESVKSGATTLVDFMYVHPRSGLTEAVIRAFDETGIRGTVARGYITTGAEYGVPEPLLEDLDHALADPRRLIRAHNVTDARVRVGLAPCMIWTVDEETLLRTRAVADEEHALVTMHVAETPFEIENSLLRFGMPDLEFLKHLGFLGPDVLAVHCVQCRERDVRILKAYDVKVSHNPCSNLYLASGVAPVPQMNLAGVTVGLGSDGPASSNNHNMIQTLKFAPLVHKGHHRDATIMTAEKALEMATIDGARALGLEDEIGSIEPGKKADLVALRYDNFCITPVHHVVSALVYSAIGSEPDLVMVDGRVVMADGTMGTVSERDVADASQRSADDLAERSGTSRYKRRPWSRWQPNDDGERRMSAAEVKNVEAPDEVRPFVDKGEVHIVTIGGTTVGRAVYEPGWRWSEHVKPLAGTESCEQSHLGYVISGRLRIALDDGSQSEIGPGDVFAVPPGARRVDRRGRSVRARRFRGYGAVRAAPGPRRRHPLTGWEGTTAGPGARAGLEPATSDYWYDTAGLPLVRRMRASPSAPPGSRYGRSTRALSARVQTTASPGRAGRRGAPVRPGGSPSIRAPARRQGVRRRSTKAAINEPEERLMGTRRVTPAYGRAVGWLTEKVAPAGSASTASRNGPASSGPATTEPPSPVARAAAASASAIQKSTLQCAASPAPARASTATTSRDTGCSGTPPT